MLMLPLNYIGIFIFFLSLSGVICAVSLPLGSHKRMSVADSCLKSPKTLPERITLAYCNWNQADEQVLEAVRNGANVLIWFSVNIAKDKDGDGRCFIQGGPDLKAVGTLMGQMREEGFDVVHLMSIGGWNSPHPDTSFSAQTMFEALDAWNEKAATLPGFGRGGFDGFDWDVEGNDDLDSPYNIFSVDCMNVMGKLSQLLKRHGYLVAMAPAESYMDPTSSEFSLRLNHNHPEWEEVQPQFLYRGRNTYALLLAKYGETVMPDSSLVDTFDFVTVQLYEGYSHALWEIRARPEGARTPAEYICTLVASLKEGWVVNFDSCPELAQADVRVTIDPRKLVIGLANGWAGEPENKFLFITPDELRKTQEALSSQDLLPRGYGFWCIAHEGDKDTHLASALSWMQKA